MAKKTYTAKLGPVVSKLKLEGSTRTERMACELFATYDQTCFLCGAHVPAKTLHRCGFVRATDA